MSKKIKVDFNRPMQVIESLIKTSNYAVAVKPFSAVKLINGEVTDEHTVKLTFDRFMDFLGNLITDPSNYDLVVVEPDPLQLVSHGVEVQRIYIKFSNLLMLKDDGLTNPENYVIDCAEGDPLRVTEAESLDSTHIKVKFSNLLMLKDDELLKPGNYIIALDA